MSWLQRTAYETDLDFQAWERAQDASLMTSVVALGLAVPGLATAVAGEGALATAGGGAVQGALLGGASSGIGDVMRGERLDPKTFATAMAVGATFGGNAGLVRAGLEGAAYARVAGVVSDALHGAGAAAMTQSSLAVGAVSAVATGAGPVGAALGLTAQVIAGELEAP